VAAALFSKGLAGIAERSRRPHCPYEADRRRVGTEGCGTAAPYPDWGGARCGILRQAGVRFPASNINRILCGEVGRIEDRHAARASASAGRAPTALGEDFKGLDGVATAVGPCRAGRSQRYRIAPGGPWTRRQNPVAGALDRPFRGGETCEAMLMVTARRGGKRTRRRGRLG